MDVHDKLDQITALMEDARAMPMSASALVNRAEVIGLLDELRDLLPEQLHHADLLLSDREAVVEQGRTQAEQLVANAQSEHDRLVEQSQVMSAARERAAAVQLTAQAEAQRLLGGSQAELAKRWPVESLYGYAARERIRGLDAALRKSGAIL